MATVLNKPIVFPCFLLFIAFGTGYEASKLDSYKCLTTKTGYIVPDPVQCDRFALCSPSGKKGIHLCSDGFGMDISTGTCDYLPKVDCSKRPKLQPPSRFPPSSPCIRSNGFFPKSGDCNSFYDCRSGKEFLHVCPSATVFDDVFATCVHPDETTREECNPNTYLNFKCPTPTSDERPQFPYPTLKFGNHDRLPYPGDCSKYFVCLLDEKPRLSSCKRPKVFNSKSGLCEHYSKVIECQTYFQDKPPKNIVVTEID